MSDVYDSPAWMEFMGLPTPTLTRIGLLFCVDAIPAFAAGTLSLKPMEFINLSLPPGVRSKAENIMLLMLLPASLGKGRAQKKYYDFAAEFELIELATTGWWCCFFSKSNHNATTSLTHTPMFHRYRWYKDKNFFNIDGHKGTRGTAGNAELSKLPRVPSVFTHLDTR